MNHFDLDKKLSELSLAEFSDFLLERVELSTRVCVHFDKLAEVFKPDPESTQTTQIFTHGSVKFHCTHTVHNPPTVSVFQEGGGSYFFLTFLGTLLLILPLPAMKFTIDGMNTWNQDVPVSWGKWVVEHGVIKSVDIDTSAIPPSKETRSYEFQGEGIEMITIGRTDSAFRLYRFCYTPLLTFGK
jgi:hypothetical protein